MLKLDRIFSGNVFFVFIGQRCVVKHKWICMHDLPTKKSYDNSIHLLNYSIKITQTR